MEKPFSPSCERNKDPILSAIRTLLINKKSVLEVGSGTGQHAVYFAKEMPWLTWQCSDLQENLAGLDMWITEAALSNLPPPVNLDVSNTLLRPQFDVIYTANTLHIMSIEQVTYFFKLIGEWARSVKEVLIYGPFNYAGEYTSTSNAQFDSWLKKRDPVSGIRDFEWIIDLATQNHLTLENDIEMPANNRLLHLVSIF
jgi:cyclopropane fatty-acyl-phospholipid synthase-like methyltransferase